MLTQKLGGFEQAVKFVTACALGDINGDFNIIEKLYFQDIDPQARPAFYYCDKAKTKIEFYNGKKELTVEKKIQFIRKIANNLQNCYLRIINHVTIENLNNQRCPNKLLGEYDFIAWNQHIHKLSDVTYQRQLVNRLDIPDAP
jgi:hypothetical protein